MTFDRVYPLVESTDDIFVSCNEEYVEALGTLLPEIPSKNYILEPEARNTGPAIALETAYLAAAGVADDEMVATVPSDDFIGDEGAFRMFLNDVEIFLESHPEYVVAPAVQPSVPSDGYSYLRPGVYIDTAQGHEFQLIGEWIEKPDQHSSRELLASGRYFAHVGMYLWQLGTAKKLWEQYRPQAWETAQKVVAAMSTGNGALVHETYGQLPKETIETLLMRHVTELAMSVDAKMQWSDIGKWHIVKHLLDKDGSGNAHRAGTVVEHDSTGNLVFAADDKLVAVLGVHDIVVVDTDDALLICPAERSGEIKDVLKHIEEIGASRHL